MAAGGDGSEAKLVRVRLVLDPAVFAKPTPTMEISTGAHNATNKEYCKKNRHAQNGAEDPRAPDPGAAPGANDGQTPGTNRPQPGACPIRLVWVGLALQTLRIYRRPPCVAQVQGLPVLSVMSASSARRACPTRPRCWATLSC